MQSINDILLRYENCKTVRGYFDKTLNDIFSAYLPRRMGMFDKTANQGKDRSIVIYDSTPGASLVRLAAVLNSTLTNQATNWFGFETDNDELNEKQEVKDWLEVERDVFRKSIENSNFYNKINEFYIDLCGPATATLYCEESKDTGKDFYFSTIHIKGVFIQEDDQGAVTGIYVVREMTAWQIMERWQFKKKTGTIPEKVQKAIDGNRQNETFEILHAVYVNDDYKEGNKLNPMFYQWASAWVMIDDKHEIDRGGYHEMPYTVEFWSKASDERYGRGPGWDALSDTKTLYVMVLNILEGGEMAVKPPVLMPHSTTISPEINWRPGGLGYFDPTSKHAPVIPNFSPGLVAGRDLLEMQRNQVRDWFYVTQLQLIDAKQMTAEEVRARMTENAKVLGPTFGRLINFIDRLFYRMRGILLRNGKMPAVPDIVKQYEKERGVKINVKFISPLVKAAALSEVQGITHTMSTALQWSADGNRPEVLDNLDLDFGIRKVSELDGAPAEFLRSEKDVKKIREARQKQLEMEQRLAEMEKAAAVSKDAAQAQDTFITSKQREMSGGLAA